MSEPHLGFARMLSSGALQHGGVVENQAFTPLLCTSCDVFVNGDHFNARVLVTHVFVNAGPAAVTACLAYKCHRDWQVTLLRVDTIDKKFLLSQQKLVAEDRDRNTGGTPAGLVADEHLAASMDIISCSLPWSILSGQTVTTTLEFFVPMDLSDADKVWLRLPSYISVFDAERLDAAKPAVGSWAGRFEQQSSPVPPTTGANPSYARCLTIRGQLAVPWAAPANVSASSAKIKATFNKRTAKQQLLARYGFLEFHFDTRSREESLTRNSVDRDDDGFTAFVARPAAIKDSTVAVESVSVAFDERAAPCERVAVAVSLAPNIGGIAPSRAFPNAEVIFLVDCSSNCVHQWGPRVQEALSVALRGLAVDSMFNVVLYGEKACLRVFERSRMASEATLEAAEAFVAGAASPLSNININSAAAGAASAGLGSQRRLFDALSTVYTEPNVAGYARTIVLVTNGGNDVAGQRSRVADLVAANSTVATLVAVALGCTADVPLLQRMVEWSSAGSTLVKVAQSYSCNQLDAFDDPAATTARAGLSGAASSDQDAAELRGRNNTNNNGVAAALASALATTLRPSLASVSVKFVSKTDGSVLPVTKIRLATRLPISVRDGNRTVVYALADADVPPCSILVTGLVGQEQQSFTVDFIGGAKAAEAHTANAQAAGNDVTRTAASFDPVYVAAVAARLGLVEVFSVRTTLKEDQVAECRRLAGTVCLPANGTCLVTRSSASATADEWLAGSVNYTWVPPSRRCGILAPHYGSAGRDTVTAAATQKKRQQQQQQQHAGSAQSAAAPSSATAPGADLFFSLNATNVAATSTQAYMREAVVERMINVVAAGDVVSAFVRFQHLNGLWDPKNEAIWHTILVRLRNRDPNTAATMETLRGSEAAKSRRPGSASDLAAARWLAALVIVSIKECSSGVGTASFDRKVGALAVKKAEAALGNDAANILARAQKHLGVALAAAE